MRRSGRLSLRLATVALSFATACTPTGPGQEARTTERAPASEEVRVPLPRTVVSVDDQRIAVHDNCHADPHLAVTEDDSTIVLSLTVEELTGGDCFSCTVVTLDAPVGARSIIDEATGEVLPQDGDCFTELD